MQYSRRAALLTLIALEIAPLGFSQIYGVPAEPGAVGNEPLATFHGAVQDIDKKLLRITLDEGNTLDFVCDRKTQYFDGKKKIKPEAIKPGDRVAVDSKRYRDGELEAIHVRLQHSKTQNAGAPKTS